MCLSRYGPVLWYSSVKTYLYHMLICLLLCSPAHTVIFWRESGLHAHKVKQHRRYSNVPTCPNSTQAQAQDVVFDGCCFSGSVWTKTIHYHSRKKITVRKLAFTALQLQDCKGSSSFLTSSTVRKTRDKDRYGTIALSAKCTQGMSQTYNRFACLVMSDFSTRIVIQHKRKGSWIEGLRNDIKWADTRFFEEKSISPTSMKYCNTADYSGLKPNAEFTSSVRNQNGKWIQAASRFVQSPQTWQHWLQRTRTAHVWKLCT